MVRKGEGEAANALEEPNYHTSHPFSSTPEARHHFAKHFSCAELQSDALSETVLLKEKGTYECPSF